MEAEYKDLYIEGTKDEMVFLIHGIFSSPEQFNGIDLMLNKRGYHVYSILLKGHGKTCGDMKNVTYNDWIRQVNTKINGFNLKFNVVHVIGHSMGCLLTVNLYNINRLGKIVLLAPAITPKITPTMVKIGILINHDGYKNTMLDRYRKLCSIQIKKIYHKIVLIYPIIQLFKLMKQTKRKVKRIKNPILIIHSKKDEMVKNKSPRYVYNTVKSQNKKLVWLEKSNHGYYNDDELKIIISEIDQFLKQNDS